jgi:DNA-binding MarR family transcriptional regulator
MTEQAQKLGMWLYLVSRAHHNLANQLFEQIGLHRGQPSVLFELDRQDGINQCELARRIEVTPATLTNLLNRLEAHLYIRRVRDPLDARVFRIYLTDAGREKTVQARAITEQMETLAFENFTAEEMETLSEYLQRLRRNLSNRTQ